MANNDFIDRLRDAATQVVPKQKLTIGYLGPDDQLTLCPLPGSEVLNGWMDGTKELSVPYEFSVKTIDQALAYHLLGDVYELLADDALQLPSMNGSYEFEQVTPQKPFLAGIDEQGFYIVQMDVVATIITTKKESN